MKISKIESDLIRYFLGLRCKMTYRLLRPLGWIRLAVLLLILAGLGTSLAQLPVRTYGPWYLVIFMAFLLCSVQLFRKDRSMLRTMRLEPFIIYFAEYLLLAVLFIILLLFNSAFTPAFSVPLLCLVIARIPLAIEIPSHKFNKYPFFNPLQLPFEWISGLRNRGFTLLLLLLSGIIAGWLHLIAGWLMTVAITGLAASFYKHCEPEDFIRLTANTSSAFITKKIRQGTGYYCLVSGILWMVLIFVYPQQWAYTGLLLLANILLLSMTIAGKYAFYREYKNIELMLSLLFGLGVLCLLIPYLVPVIAVLTGWLAVRANSRLERIVYDIH